MVVLLLPFLVFFGPLFLYVCEKNIEKEIQTLADLSRLSSCHHHSITMDFASLKTGVSIDQTIGGICLSSVQVFSGGLLYLPRF